MVHVLLLRGAGNHMVSVLLWLTGKCMVSVLLLGGSQICGA